MRVPRTLLPLLALSIAGWTPAASAAKATKADYQIKLTDYNIPIREYSFPSGLRIVFEEDHTRPLVSVTNVIDVGAADEVPELSGMAHLIEHLNFRARHGELPKNMDLIKQVAGNFNAFTSLDTTTYLTIGPADAMVPLLKLESLRLTNAVAGVTETVMATEREVVRNELRMDVEQNPDYFSYLYESLFPEGHPYKRNVIGTHETLNRVTLKDVQSFVDTYYRPDRATIVVVGDFKMDDTWRYIQDSFSMSQLADPKDPNRPIELVELPPRIQGPAAEPPPPATREVRHEKGLVDKTTLVLGWSLPAGHRGNDAQMSLTVGMMQSVIGWYLFPNYDYQNEDIDSFGCGYQAMTDGSVAMCFIEMAADQKPENYIDKALGGLSELWNTDNRYQVERGQFTQSGLMIDRVFSSAKLSVMAGVLSSVDQVNSLFGRGLSVAETLHYTGDPAYYSRSFSELSGVNGNAAAELAFKYLNRDRAVAVVVEPFSEEEKAKAQKRGADNTYDGVTRDDQLSEFFKDGELTNDRIRDSIVPPDLSRRRTITLDTGLQVEIIPHGSAPLVQTYLQFRGGATDVGPSYVGSFWDKFGQWDYLTGLSPLEFAGGRGFGIGELSTYVQGQGAAGNLTAQLNEVRIGVETLNVGVPRSGQFAKERRKSRDGAEQDPATWASRARNSHLYPGHPFSEYTTDALLKEMADFGKSEAEKWVHDVMRPDNGVLFIVGNLDPDKAEADVRAVFGDWKGKASPTASAKPIPAAPAPGDRKILIYDKAGATQTEVAMACQFGPANMENGASRRVLTDLYTSSLWRELRETLGATYGAYASSTAYPGGIAELGAETLIQTRSVDHAIKVIFRGVESLKAGEVDALKLQTSKWNIGRQVTVGFQTSDDVIGSLSSYALWGWPIEAAISYRDRLAAVSSADFAPLLERCVGHEIITLVGPKDELVSEVQEAGYTAEVVDWKALVQTNEKGKKK